MKYKIVIGLEVHVQLNTRHKMFAMEQASFGASPNTQTSPTTLAHPGTMPSLNSEAVDNAIKMGIACQSTITRENWFDRKSYVYPGNNKGYQITQQRTPICVGGFIVIDTPSGKKEVELERIHLEEDTGKIMYTATRKKMLLDLNRAGKALIEIVTKPTMTSPEEAGLFVQEVQRMVRYLGISDGHMERASLRCDANVSTMPISSTVLEDKVELKNMNSVRHVCLSIAEEVRRQIACKKAGGKIVVETRSYNPQTGKNEFLRSKQNLSDYRYIVEPNIGFFEVDENHVERLKSNMPILPRALAHRFMTAYQLSAADTAILTSEKEIGLFFQAVCQHTKHYKIAANWLIGPVKSYLNHHKIGWSSFPIAPATIAKLADVVAEGTIGFSIASQKLFTQLIETPDRDPGELIALQQLNISDDQQLVAWIDEVLATYADKVVAYQQGKKSLLGLFMGEVMKISQRKANPKKTQELLKQKLTALAIQAEK